MKGEVFSLVGDVIILLAIVFVGLGIVAIVLNVSESGGKSGIAALDASIQSCLLLNGNVNLALATEIDHPSKRNGEVVVAADYDGNRYLIPRSNAVEMKEGKYSGIINVPLPTAPLQNSQINFAFFIANSCVYDKTTVPDSGGFFEKKLSDLILDCSDFFIGLKTVETRGVSCQ